MGYTHYWGFETDVTNRKYQAALRDCRKIIKASPVPLGNGHGEGKPVLRNGFSINGLGGDSFETFAFDSTPDSENWFCKTGRREYDVVVVACLCTLKLHLGDECRVTSDGDPHEWEAGRELASKVLGQEIKIPQLVIDQRSMYGWAAKQYREQHPEYAYTSLDITHPGHQKETVPSWAKGQG